MAKITWDETGERRFEMGDKKCALYLYDDKTKKYGKGSAWNGITAVTESPSGAEPEDLWADDIKYATLRSAEQLGGTIEAYTYPDEFEACNGEKLINGVVVGMQKRAMFGLTYVTSVGNDVNSDAGYKLHLIWGATASPSERSYQTVNDSPEAITFSWEFTTNPVKFTYDGAEMTTSILVIDSTKLTEDQLGYLKTLEEVLYGTDDEDGYLPTPEEVLDIMKTGEKPSKVSTSSYGLSD